MNELNQIESQLVSWKPRRPSPGLQRRLFPKSTGFVPVLAGLAIGRWLAPAMALFVLCAVYLSESPEFLPENYSSSLTLMATASLDHPNLGTLYAADRANERNIWAASVFEWTNTGQSVSTTAPWPKNNLMP